MRILFLTHELPVPLDNGDRIYTFNILRELVRHGNRVHVVAFEKERLPSDELREFLPPFEGLPGGLPCVELIPFRPKSHARAFFSRFPGMIANRRSRHFVKAVRSILNTESGYDLIIVNHFKMSYLVESLQVAKTRTPAMLITHNSEASLSRTVYRFHRNHIRKFAYWVDYLKTSYFERRYLSRYDGVTAISPFDKSFFETCYDLKNIFVLPPSVHEKEIKPFVSPDPSRNRRAIVCGSFFWEPKRINLMNLLDCSQFDSLIENDIELFVVGSAPADLVDEIRSRSTKLTATGRVADVGPYYEQCSVALIPEKMGGGFKLKILEAVLYNQAIVAIKGAVAAPGFIQGEHFLEASDYDEMIQITIELMNDGNRCRQLAENAHRLLRSHYLWENNYRSLVDFLPGKDLRVSP